MNKILVMGLMALVFTSCQSEPAKTGNVIIPTPTGVPSASGQQVPSGQRPDKNPEHGQPFHDCALPVGAAFASAAVPAQPQAAPAPVDLPVEVQQKNTTPATKEVKLNPAHGAPGHKCEIAVGAPLT